MDVVRAGRPSGRRRMSRRKDRRVFSKTASSHRRENMVPSWPMRLGIRL